MFFLVWTWILMSHLLGLVLGFLWMLWTRYSPPTRVSLRLCLWTKLLGTVSIIILDFFQASERCLRFLKCLFLISPHIQFKHLFWCMKSYLRVTWETLLQLCLLTFPLILELSRTFMLGCPVLLMRSGFTQLFKQFWDVFMWSYEEMLGIDPTIMVHKIPTYPGGKLVR